MKYHCNYCFYVYNEADGEPDCDIAPNTKFDEIPEDYECPLCHNSKFSFISETDYLSKRS